jgi:hypothetical protein
VIASWIAVEGNPQIQMGQDIFDSGNDPSFADYNREPGERSCVRHVNFEKPFENMPEVAVNINRLDCGMNRNTRVSANPVNITKSGFDLKYKTWGDSVTYAIGVNWMAIDKS